MLTRDLAFYRTLLRRLPLGDLVKLYDQTVGEYPVLAQSIAQELDKRLGECPLEENFAQQNSQVVAQR